MCIQHIQAYTHAIFLFLAFDDLSKRSNVANFDFFFLAAFVSGMKYSNSHQILSVCFCFKNANFYR